jgi:hypothetical protein
MARAKRRANRADNDQSEFENELENEIENGEENAEEMGEAMREMGNATQRQFRHAQNTAVESLDLFGGPMVRLMDQNWQIFQKLMHAVREESLDFVNRRLEQTSHAIENSRDADGLSGLLAVQQEWMAGFARDYVEQTKRFGELVRDLAQDGTANVSHAATEIAERGRETVEEETRHAAA